MARMALRNSFAVEITETFSRRAYYFFAPTDPSSFEDSAEHYALANLQWIPIGLRLFSEVGVENTPGYVKSKRPGRIRVKDIWIIPTSSV